MPFLTGVRFTLGIAQMFMAAFSLVLLIQTGFGRFTMVSVVFTGVLTLTSRLLFRRREAR